MSSDKFFFSEEKKEIIVKSLEKDESILFWKSLKDRKDFEEFIYENSNIQEDLEVNLPNFIRNNPRLSNFTLQSREPMIKFDTTPLNESLKGLELKELNIDGKLKEDDNLGLFLNCFKDSKIQSLSFYELIIDDKLLETICSQNIEKQTNEGSIITSIYLYEVQNIKFHLCLIKSESSLIYKFLTRFCSLKNLSFLSNRTKLDLKELYLSLKGKNLTKLKLQEVTDCINIEYYKNLLSLPIKSLKIIRLWEKRLYLIPFFKYLNENLINLNLNRAIQDLDGIEDYLEKSKKIEKLEIGNNELDETSLELLGVGISKNRSLKHLFFNNIGIEKSFSVFMDGLQMNTCIENLNITFSHLKSEHCQLISLYLSKNQTLKELNLDGNFITEKGFEKIIKVLLNHQYLKSLNLSKNSIGISSSLHLKDLLKSNTKLETLNISYCLIPDNGMIQIAEGLQYNTNLTTLDFSKNISDKKTCQNIEDILFYNTGLKKINPTFKEIINRNSTFVHVLKIEIYENSNVYFLFQ